MLNAKQKHSFTAAYKIDSSKYLLWIENKLHLQQKFCYFQHWNIELNLSTTSIATSQFKIKVK